MQSSRCVFFGCIYAACLAVVSAGCSKDDPEQALRANVTGLQAAVDARDAGAIEDRLAEGFVGPEGLDRQGARRMAQLVFLRHQNVSARLGPLDVSMQDDHATVRFTAVLTGGAGGLLPETGQLYD
ncbi:MAG: nuclear transport factor 2 family protein, partial [Lysobacter sp.]|nr:nuclear transport factor 2 family protein [Lysobacter sp.]